MTTIAWYPDGGTNGPATHYSGEAAYLPDTASVGVAPNVSASLVAGGFVGEPVITGVIQFVTSWAAAPGSVAPNVSMSTYEVYETVGWTVIRNPQYIAVAAEPSHSGVLRIQVKIDGALAEGTLVLTLTPVGAGYSDLAWDWESSAPGVDSPFWTDLVSARQA